MKKNIKNLLFVVLLALFAVLTLTGCNGVLDSSADESETVSVSFGVDSSSRALYVDVVSDYEIGNLYWAYTATHKSGLHYIGESEVLGVSGDTGTDGIKAGGYKLKPVRRGAVKGLGIADDKFSRGNWTFKLYGYTGYNESTGVFSGLVYTGTTVESEVSLYTPSLYTPQFTDGFVAVNFLLTEFDGTDTGRTATAGKLVVAPLTFTIPEDMVLHSGKTLCAELADNSGSGSPVRKLYCELPMTQTLRAGEKIVLPFANVTGYDGTWDTGSTNGEKLLSLKWKLWVEEHPETGDPIVGDTLAEGVIVDIPVRAGASTFLYGDIDDVARQSTNPVPTSLMEPVCYTGTPGTNTYKEWTSLAEAINSGSDNVNTNVVYLYRDVNNAGVIYKAATLEHNGFSVSNLVWGADKSISVAKAVGIGGRTGELAFKAGDIVSFAVGNDEYKTMFFDVWSQDGAFATSSGCNNMYITGYCNRINVVSANTADTTGKLGRKLGVHIYGKCDTILIRCDDTEYIELGPNAVIGTFKVDRTSALKSVVEGYPTTTVNNLAIGWNDNTTYFPSDVKTALSGTTNSLLVPVTFDANSESVYSGCVVSGYAGSCTGTKTVYWIKGMPIPMTSTFLSGFKMTACKSATQKTALGFKTFRDSEDGVPASGSNYFAGATSIPCNGPMTLYAYYSNYHLYAQKVYCLNTGDAAGCKFATGITFKPASGTYKIAATFRITSGSSNYRTLIGSNGSFPASGASAVTSSSAVGVTFMATNNTGTHRRLWKGGSYIDYTFSKGAGSAIVIAGEMAVPDENAAFGYNWGEGIMFYMQKNKAGLKRSSASTLTTTVGSGWTDDSVIWIGGFSTGSDTLTFDGDIGEIAMFDDAGTTLYGFFAPCVLRAAIPTGNSASGTADAKGTAGMWNFVSDKFYKSTTAKAFKYRKFKDGSVLTSVTY